MRDTFFKDHKKTALYYKGKSISYHQLWEQVNSISSHLNLVSGVHVAIFAENSPYWIYGLYAVWNKGGVAVPYDFSATETELNYVFKDAQPKVLLTSNQGKSKLDQLKNQSTIPGQVLILENLAVDGAHPGKVKQREMEDIALILYISGTTGEPKGVMLSFSSILFNINAVIESNMLHADGRLMALFPFHHIVPLQGHILCPLYIGSTVVFVETLSAEAIMDTFQKYKITVINGVPRLYERFHQSLFRKIKANPIGRILLRMAKIIKNQPFRRFLFSRIHRAFGGHVRYLLSGGAPLDKKILDYAVITTPIPRARLGKIKRHQLNELLQPATNDTFQRVTPTSKEYRLIQTYLEKESGLHVNPDSHLEIDLGLDSLAIIDLKIFLENTFGFSTPETIFIDHATVGSLSTYFQNNKTTMKTSSSGLTHLLKTTKIEIIKKNKFAFYLLWTIFYPILSILYQVKKQGVHHISQMMEQGKNLILALNHQSFLDALLLSRTLPIKILKNTYFLAKAKHFQFPLGHFFKNNLNTILMDINQESEKIIRNIIAILKQGKNVVVFPEGTRSYTGKVGRFSNTFAILSKELKIPVFPVGIKGTYDLLPRNKTIPRPGKVNIEFFPAVDPITNNASTINTNVLNTLREFVEA